MTLEELRCTYRAEYDNKYCTMVRWYEGVVNELNLLASFQEVSLTIVTNKPTQPTNTIINSAGLALFFDSVIGIDYRNQHGLGSALHPSLRPSVFAMSLTNCPRQYAVYVGDTHQIVRPVISMESVYCSNIWVSQMAVK